MKYVILQCDGMADDPRPELGNKTPMQAAVKPHMDRLAAEAEQGRCKTVPDGLTPGSDVANLSILGYDPRTCFTGRSPLEAAGMGIALSDTDITYRCNLVTLSEEEPYDQKRMVDYCGGDVSGDDARELVNALEDHFGSERFTFYFGTGYRHCLMDHKGVFVDGGLTPPHDIGGQCIAPHLCREDWAAPLLSMMRESVALLTAHPVNQRRRERGLRPANAIWLWGQGTKPGLVPFQEKYGKTGAVISAVYLIKGIGKCAGMDTPDVPGATGYIDTNFAGKAEAALQELRDGRDFAFVHVEAPDECGHRRETGNKVLAIERIDELLLGPLLTGLASFGEYRLLVMPDHPTLLESGTHSGAPVPYLLWGAGIQANGVSGQPAGFSEASAAATGLYIDEGVNLIQRLFR